MRIFRQSVVYLFFLILFFVYVCGLPLLYLFPFHSLLGTIKNGDFWPTLSSTFMEYWMLFPTKVKLCSVSTVNFTKVELVLPFKYLIEKC